MLEELLEMLSAAAPKAQLLWNHSQVVSLICARAARAVGADVDEAAGAARIATGRSERAVCDGTRLPTFGSEPEFEASRAMSMSSNCGLSTADDLHRGDLAAFLREHAAAISRRNGGQSRW